MDHNVRLSQDDWGQWSEDVEDCEDCQALSGDGEEVCAAHDLSDEDVALSYVGAYRRAVKAARPQERDWAELDE